MEKNFTYDAYTGIADSFKKVGSAFLPFIEYISNNNGYKKCIVLRHDVDKLPENAIRMARLENKLEINASYYFRAVQESYDENIIRQIAGMGHEIGYHYEDLSICQGNYQAAIKHFELQLEKLRKICPVKTICSHGSPLSKYDNKKIWEKYDYRDYGVIAEPYFDVDYNEVFYISDTGRSWNNSDASVRDKVITTEVGGRRSALTEQKGLYVQNAPNDDNLR